MLLQEVKKLTEKLDEYNRKGEDAPDSLYDEIDLLWKELSSEEIKEANNYSAYLFTLWTPMENFLNAVDCFKSSTNETTKQYWLEKIKEHYGKLTEQEKEKVYAEFKMVVI